ncbi:MAG: TIM-barrel domain-containing protein, partial [Promethearchaeota archaeon]
MIHLAKSGNRFDLYYQNSLFFSHRNDEPAVILGISTPKPKIKTGLVNISEKIQRRIPMNRFSVEVNTQNRVVFQFSNSDTYESIKMEFRAGDELLITFKSENHDVNRIWIHLPSHMDENVYGGGQQFGRVCLNNQKISLFIHNRFAFVRNKRKIKVTEGISSFPLPVFLAIAKEMNYLCWINTFLYGEIAFHCTGKKGQFHEMYFWGIPDQILIKNDNHPLNLLTYLTSKIGRQPILPKWVLNGVCLTVSGDLIQIQEEIENEAESKTETKLEIKVNALEEAGITVTAVWCPDWAGVKMNKTEPLLFWDWKWNGSNRPIRYPNLPKLVDNFNKKGVHVLGYVNGFLNRKGDIYQDILDKSHLLSTKFDTEYIIHQGNQDNAVIDLTLPKARAWFANTLQKELIENVGFSGWFGGDSDQNPIDSVAHEREDPYELHNQYPGLLAQTCYEAIQNSQISKNIDKPEERIFFTAVGHQNALSFTSIISAGVLNPSWDYSKGFGAAITSAISAGLSGLGYHHSIVGGWGLGGSIKRSKEL